MSVGKVMGAWTGIQIGTPVGMVLGLATMVGDLAGLAGDTVQAASNTYLGTNFDTSSFDSAVGVGREILGGGGGFGGAAGMLATSGQAGLRSWFNATVDSFIHAEGFSGGFSAG